MRIVIQRVNQAQVNIDGKCVGKIAKGFLLLVGLRDGDDMAVVKKVCKRIDVFFSDISVKTMRNASDSFSNSLLCLKCSNSCRT